MVNATNFLRKRTGLNSQRNAFASQLKFDEVELMCQEITEDIVNQACGIDSEPANTMVAILRDTLNDLVTSHGHLHMSPFVIAIMGERTSLEAVQLFICRLQNSRSVHIWEDVIRIYLQLALFARYLASREDTDAEFVVNLVKEFCSDAILQKMVPWIVEQGGWDFWMELYTAKYGQQHVTVWATRKVFFASLLFIGAIGTLTSLAVKIQRNI